MNKKVLFLDDDRFEMRSLVDRLDATGFSVKNYADDYLALDELKRGYLPSLIVSDLIMRGAPAGPARHARGVQFCREAREIVGDQSKIVALTVVTDPNVRDEVLEFADDFLVKPITPREFIYRLNLLGIG